MDEPKRPLWRKKRWWAAAVLWLLTLYPLSAFVAGYAHGRGWLPTSTAETIYGPLLTIELFLKMDPVDDWLRWGDRIGRGSIARASKHKLTGMHVDWAIGFVTRHKRDPFYLHLWLNDVHDPHSSERLLAWKEEIAELASPQAKIGASGRRTFMNPIAEGADPWVVRHDGWYYWCQSEDDRSVAVWKSDRLTDLGEPHVVWTAPESGPHSKQVWAPELHFLDSRWYVYVAASDGENANHRMIVLESDGDDPIGPYHFKSELYTGDSVTTGTGNRWAIDGTVFEHGGFGISSGPVGRMTETNSGSTPPRWRNRGS